jgi:hypothetical protein
MIMKALLSSYNINISTTHEARNAKVLCLFAKAASSGPFVFCTLLYNIHFFSIDHGSRRPRPRRVGARYGRPVAQKIATGLLYRRPKVWCHESKGVVLKIASR